MVSFATAPSAFEEFKKSLLPIWASCLCFAGMGTYSLGNHASDYLYEYASFVPKEQQKEVWDEWAADGGPKILALFGVGSIPSFILCYGGESYESLRW